MKIIKLKHQYNLLTTTNCYVTDVMIGRSFRSTFIIRRFYYDEEIDDIYLKLYETK